MENNFINGLQLYRGRWFSDLVEESMLSNALMTKPHEVATVVSYVFGSKDSSNGSIIDFLTGGLGKTMYIDQRQYEWNVLIDTDRAVTIKSARWNGVEITSANVDTITPGLGNTPILLHLEDKLTMHGPHKLLRIIVI